MELLIENAGAIEKATLNIEKDKINIKYGLNGVGKSTIGKSIFYQLEDKEKLKELIKYESEIIPKVTIPTTIQSAIYFDQNYVKQFLFKKDILNNSYEIIIKTKDYENKVFAIEQELGKLKEKASTACFNDFTNVINDFDKKFPISKTGKISESKNAVLVKGLDNGGDLLKHLDEKTDCYKKFLGASNNFEWSDWFKKGNEFIDENDNVCPFCCNDLGNTFGEKREKILTVFDSEKIKFNFESKKTLTDINNYFPKLEKEKIKRITEVNTKPTSEELENVKILFAALKHEKNKLVALKETSPYELVKMLDGRAIEIFLSYNKLNLEIFDDFSEEDKKTVIEINNLIDNLLNSINAFKKNVGNLQSELAKAIKNTKKYVNDFLNIAGIPYCIDILDLDSSNYQTVLKPKNIDKAINEPDKKLSFGEQNAISLILFSIEALSKNKDLIILDDPVSSFDETKKYAILYHLFKSGKQQNFYNKTILMLTHDFSTILDFNINGKPNRDNTTTSYIYNKNSEILEKVVTKLDIKHTIELEESSIKNKENNIVSRLVHLRRLLELKRHKELAYEMLSSLFHLCSSPHIKKYNDENNKIKCIAFSENQIEVAETEISSYIDGFTYKEFLLKMLDDEFLINLYNDSSDFGKLNIARIYIQKNQINHENEVLWKYLCEAFHIENNYLFYLDYDNFNLVPEYIIKECDSIIFG